MPAKAGISCKKGDPCFRRDDKLRRIVLALLVLICCTQAQASSLDTIIAKPDKWLNTERPLTTDDFAGRAVLLDFWTYGCINCMQIIPDLEHLEKTFGNKLVIVGVHSAKFQGEKGDDRILSAAKRFGLKHPVFNDADFAVWDAYGVKAWPTQILLGANGAEVGRYLGEGHRAEIEKDIAALNIADQTSAIPLETETVSSTLSFPARIKASKQVLLIADTGHNQILMTDKKGKIIDRIGSGQKALKDGDYKTASFNQPRGFLAAGDKIYVADTGNHALREINIGTRQVTTLIGDGTRGKKGKLASPWDVAELDGDLVIANAGTHQLLSYDISDQKLSVLAGSGREALTDGKADKAALAQPSALAVDGDVLYFVDAESSALRKLEDGDVKTLIGTGLFDFGLKDGKYPEARLQHPQGLAVTDENILIADTYNNVIRVFNKETEELSVLKVAGDMLNEPGDVFVMNGQVYVADTNNNQIRTFNIVDEKASDFKNAVKFQVSP